MYQRDVIGVTIVWTTIPRLFPTGTGLSRSIFKYPSRCKKYIPNFKMFNVDIFEWDHSYAKTAPKWASIALKRLFEYTSCFVWFPSWTIGPNAILDFIWNDRLDGEDYFYRDRIERARDGCFAAPAFVRRERLHF